MWSALLCPYAAALPSLGYQASVDALPWVVGIAIEALWILKA